MALLYVPLTPDRLAAWQAEGALDGAPVHVAAPSYLVAFELDDPESEDTEFQLLGVASLASLLLGPRRLVAVVEGVAAATSDDFGRTSAARLPWSAVTAVFGDDADGRAAAEVLHGQLAESDLDAAWGRPDVVELLEGHHLGWFGPTEIGLLLEH